MKQSLILQSAVIGFALILPIGPLFAHAGLVIFTSGEVSALDKNAKPRQLKRGEKFWPGETIITGKDSRVQLRAGDGSSISLQPNTKFVVTEHKHTGPVAEQNSLVELVKGGMRAVTGAIGKTNPEHYKIKARNSLIGVRGTEIVIQLCDDNCTVEKTTKDDKTVQEKARDGIYVGVLSGGITVENNKGQVDLDSGLKVVLGQNMGIDNDKRQYVFIGEQAGIEAKPQALPEPPAVLLQALTPPPPAPGQAEAPLPESQQRLPKYAGLDTAYLTAYMQTIEPHMDHRAVLEPFDLRAAPVRGLDPLQRHRDNFAPLIGNAAGTNYDLLPGNPRCCY